MPERRNGKHRTKHAEGADMPHARHHPVRRTALSAAPTKKAAFSAPMAVLLTPICASFTPAEFKNRPKPAKRKNTEKKRE